MSIYVIFGTPGAFDFEALGESTRRTLALLAPWVDLQDSDEGIAPEILDQVAEFVRAIRLGVDAAQCGFTAIKDILALTNYMDSTTPAERQEYLLGTLKLADKAYSKAQEAFQAFRDIRTKIFSMTEKLNVLSDNIASVSSPSPIQTDNATRRSIEEIENSIKILQEFGDKVSALAQWWDWIQVETNINPETPLNRKVTVSFDDSSLRETYVVERWKLLRDQFVDYTNMVNQLEDSYPQFLVSSPEPPNQRAEGNIHRPDLHQAIAFIAEMNMNDAVLVPDIPDTVSESTGAPTHIPGSSGHHNRGSDDVRRSSSTIDPTLVSIQQAQYSPSEKIDDQGLPPSRSEEERIKEKEEERSREEEIKYMETKKEARARELERRREDEIARGNLGLATIARDEARPMVRNEPGPILMAKDEPKKREEEDGAREKAEAKAEATGGEEKAIEEEEKSRYERTMGTANEYGEREGCCHTCIIV